LSPRSTGTGPWWIAQFVCTEGLPAACLAIIVLALARAARGLGAVTAARTGAVAGVLAAIVSLTQCVLGVPGPLIVTLCSPSSTTSCAFWR
jgi:hypothetical protein